MNPATKPTDTTSDRVVRGGSWNSGVPSWVRAESFGTGGSANPLDILGFRTHLAVRQPRV